MATKEDIYHRLIRIGIDNGWTVVPEFKVRTSDWLVKKDIDLVWLRPRQDERQPGSLGQWQVLAAFEIEGCDVPLNRIDEHSSQFRALRQQGGIDFPCVVPLYTVAYHRVLENWGFADPQALITQRQRRAAIQGDVVQVVDGRDEVWMDEVARWVAVAL